MLVSSGTLHAQEQTLADTKNLIVYDPLFWKDELRLSADQSRKIQAINVTYYEELIAYYYENNRSPKGMEDEIQQQLIRRSEKIWGTFQPKQKRKWEKLQDKNYALHSS